jgi:AcrR family transcriptional regulator
MTVRGPGRPRDPDLDDRILGVTRHHLATNGYDAMSLVAIAEQAGTTRQALYRRWPSKADLATAAIAAMARAGERDPTDDVYVDLVAELEAFRRGISRPDGISMVGTMLLDSTDAELVDLYRERLVTPRRERFRQILERARSEGHLDEHADIEVAVNMLTGAWYANALTGRPPVKHWAERVAALTWRALGGECSPFTDGREIAKPSTRRSTRGPTR